MERIKRLLNWKPSSSNELAEVTHFSTLILTVYVHSHIVHRDRLILTVYVYTLTYCFVYIEIVNS